MAKEINKRPMTLEELQEQLPLGRILVRDNGTLDSVYCLPMRGTEDEERYWLYKAPSIALQINGQSYNVRFAWGHESINGFIKPTEKPWWV